MQAIKELYRRITQQAESVPPAPQPEIINEEIHPLRFYPGFNTFLEEWNSHATTPTRIGLQGDIQSAQIEMAKLPNKSSFLRLEIQTLKEEQQRQRKIFDANQNVPKKERFPPLKSANRRFRRAREELDRISQQEKRIRQSTEARLETAITSLVDLDDEFAFSLEENGVRFYVVERLRKDPEAIDAFLLRYCARKGLSRRRQESELWSINYDFFALLRCYTNPEAALGQEELKAIKANTDEATNRQLRKLPNLRIRSW